MRESQPLHAPQVDDGNQGPEDIETAGERGRLFLSWLKDNWEEQMLLSSAFVRVLVKNGFLASAEVPPLYKNWRELGKYLLTLHNSKDPIAFDMERFGTTEEAVRTFARAGNLALGIAGFSRARAREFLGTFTEILYSKAPMMLAAWVRGSQRIFALSEKSQQRFENAEYGARTWEDFLRPFDAFVIALKNPIVLPEYKGKRGYISALLVTQLSAIDPEYPTGFFECQPLGSTSPGVVPASILTPRQRKVLSAISKGNRDPAQVFDLNLQENLGEREYSAFQIDVTARIEESDLSPVTNQMRKIIAGTSIYLLRKREKPEGTLPPKPWPPLTGLTHMNVITDPAQVISIGHAHDFDPNAEVGPDDEDKEGGPRAPHHRRAFMR